MILFVDTSALGSVYLDDEVDSTRIAQVIFHGPDPVVLSELADVELASLLARARREGRIDETGMADCLAAYLRHTADNGPLGVLPLTHDTVLRAREIVLDFPVRTLDALHLAAASILADASEEHVAILTRDVRQASAAQSLGLPCTSPRPVDRVCNQTFRGIRVPRTSTPCGDAGIRTPYLLRAKQALYQVSYIPAGGGASWTRTRGLSLIRTAL